MKKETVKKVVEGVGAFGTGALAAVPVCMYRALVGKRVLVLELPMLVASWALHMGLFEEYIEPTLDFVVDQLMDDDPAETVTE